ncbi:MAG: metallophosphoesterase family protein [Isosphaeraceae bacterium]|nr:metallophosphoesterase family protein [Isosphaeraceae bacterium]
MRTLAIGDIHGCYDALIALTGAIALRPSDRIVSLGDYIDRGPDSRRVIDWLIDYSEANPGRLFALRGNHELMLEGARLGGKPFGCWLAAGGIETLRSYGLEMSPTELLQVPHDQILAAIPDRHWKFIERELLPFHEIDTHFFVHANAHPERELDAQSPFMLYWELFGEARPHRSGKVMVCGHSVQASGLPSHVGHSVCIDTGACRGRWLTCLEVETGVYWQANQAGETRSGRLDASSAAGSGSGIGDGEERG